MESISACNVMKIKMNSGKWPTDEQAVKRAYKKRQKMKAKALRTWNKCAIHKDQICLPCFYIFG